MLRVDVCAVIPSGATKLIIRIVPCNDAAFNLEGMCSETLNRAVCKNSCLPGDLMRDFIPFKQRFRPAEIVFAVFEQMCSVYKCIRRLFFRNGNVSYFRYVLP